MYTRSKNWLKKHRDAFKRTAWYQKWGWIVEIAYRGALIYLYIDLARNLVKRWEDFQVMMVDPREASFFIQFVGTVGLIILGMLLFALRMIWREQYGWIEVVTAGAAGWFAMGRFLATDKTNVDELGLALVGMLACVYLVVRGFDNVFHPANEKHQKEIRGIEIRAAIQRSIE